MAAAGCEVKLLKILIIEDDVNIARLIELELGYEGYQVCVAHEGNHGIDLFKKEQPDLVLLDIMLPGLDGIEVCKRLRGISKVPVIMLTAKDGVQDRVGGLDSGADDYLTKPFGVRELVARARALLRRPRQSAASDAAPNDGDGVIRVRGMVIDVPKRRVTVENQQVELTDQEFRLLHLLATHPGIVFSREALLAKIWRGDTFVTARNIDTLVKRLRQKVEANPSEPALILTVWGAGYKAADV